MALDPRSEDTNTYPLDADELMPFQPSCCVGIPGREHSFLNCGEYIVLREPLLAIDAVVHGDAVTLPAKVGQILQISPMGESRRTFLSLLFYASQFPTSRIPEGAAPPDRRQYMEYPQHIVAVEQHC
jgi:hypothetical protein